MWYTYVLYSPSSDKHYTGFTGDLKKRLEEHRMGTTRTTSQMKDLELVYYEACRSKDDALDRERQLKTGFGRAYLRNRLKNDKAK
jgi:putative endonuclease